MQNDNAHPWRAVNVVRVTARAAAARAAGDRGGWRRGGAAV